MKILDNRRKSRRFRIPLNMEFIPLKGAPGYSLGKTRNFSREGLSFASNSVDNEPEEPIMIKFKLLQEHTYIYALGDIIWKRQVANKYWVGVKIKEIDKESRSEKLGFPFNIWVDNMPGNN